MAKKKAKKEVAVKETVTEQEIMEVLETPEENIPNPFPVENKPVNTWEIKDRVYILKRGAELSHTIKSRNIFYFDEDKNIERELKYTSNQQSPFVDEFRGEARLAHITFRDGKLYVPKNKQTLQKLLSLYHPERDKVYYEHKPEAIASNEVDLIELEIEALTTAQELDIDMAEAIMRVELGSKVSNMSSKELKRDLLIFAKRNPKLLLDLVNDDNVHLRNIGIKATEMGMLTLSPDQRTFTWASNGRKLMNVPFDEHPYSALAAWFKTDEGMEVYSSIEKRLK